MLREPDAPALRDAFPNSARTSVIGLGLLRLALAKVSADFLAEIGAGLGIGCAPGAIDTVNIDGNNGPNGAKRSQRGDGTVGMPTHEGVSGLKQEASHAFLASRCEGR